jgi:RNA polymerase sigma-32 factor
MREKERLMNQGIEPDVKLLSENLGVPEKTVAEMDMRLSSSGSEVSLDKPLFSDSSATLSDTISDEAQGIEEELGFKQGMEILQDQLQEYVANLKPRDKEIFKKTAT